MEEEQNDIDLSGEILALASALSNLQEIDPALLSQKRKGRLARMKRQIFDTLSYYCDCLPQLKEDEQGTEP